MSQSIKHHYLPEFYLRGFANDSGRIAIYDCKKGRVKKGEYPPSTHFFQKNRNTVKFKEKENLVLEDLYSSADNRHSRLFQFIQDYKGAPTLSNEQMSLLQEFVLGIFWRLPANDKYYDENLSRNPAFTKIIQVVDVETGIVDDKVTNEFRKFEPFLKSMRALAPFFSILNSRKSFDFKNWRIAYHPNGFNFCSDNPIIIKEDNVKDILETDFIMPLTKYHTLIRTLKTHSIETMPPILVANTHCLIFKQSINYCGASRRDYLESMSKIAQNYRSEDLKKSIFEFLGNPVNI